MLAEDYVSQCQASGDYRLQKIASVYALYEKKLWAAGALDFDDIIFHTVRLLQQHPDVREYYQNKFRYVLIDEYQDTNHLQYLLASLLTGPRKNICVVGDDDQSIYRFRGATIENILSFESEYQAARVIRLEQNYRSTGNILNAANAVIRHNRGRKGKTLWTDHGEGEKVQVYTAGNERDEGLYIASQLLKAYGEGKQWKDCAVLYRMNALSNQVEIALKSSSIPYRVVGGFRFFERAEVKDMLSYLCVVHNPSDDLRLLRVVNNPPRGLGAKTLETARAIAAQEDRSLWEIISHADRWPELQKAAPKFQKFTDLMGRMAHLAETVPLPEFYDALVEESGYAVMLEGKKDNDSKTRLENVRELKSSLSGYLDQAEDPTLGGFLDEVALYTDLDSVEDTDNCVTLMTMHAAKGLEFPVVFAVGMEEGVFPGYRAIGESEELEEERRLCYVALTRAKEKLYLTCAAQRMLFGRTSANLPSRFVREIPEELVEEKGRPRRQPQREGFREEDFSQVPPSVRSAKPAPAAYRQPAPKAAPLPDYHKGDMVRHSAFGQGMILSVQYVGGDALMEIAFDNVGTKRMMLKTASNFMQKL
jgi:DNA helicase-2/ATP-dependent DNA helicase PcrA